MAIQFPAESPLPEGYTQDPLSRKRFERRYFLVRFLWLSAMIGVGASCFYLANRNHDTRLLVVGVTCWLGGLFFLLGSLLLQSRAKARCAKCGKEMRIEKEHH